MKFILHWKNGKKETIEGNTILDATTTAGYKEKDIDNLDFYVDEDHFLEYVFNAKTKAWESI